MSNDLMKHGIRKERKQLAEKRRRQKMNDILLQIRDLVYHEELIRMMDTENQRIEKTEILERAVDVIKKENAKQKKIISSSDEMYQRGFSTCLSEINSFFLNVDCSPQFRHSLLGHMTKINSNSNINLEQPPLENTLYRSAKSTDFKNSTPVFSHNQITKCVNSSSDRLVSSDNKWELNGLWRPWSS